MKARGIEASSATIGRIASEFEIRHSEGCREQNRRNFPFRCRCDFFDRVGEHLETAGHEETQDARVEAERLFATGYRQVSRKYARVARLVSGSWEDSREVSEAVLVQLRRLHKAAFAEYVAGRLAHFKTVMNLVPGDACEYRLADNRLGRDHAPTTDWLPGSVVENGRLGAWKIKRTDSDEIVRARPENVRRPVSG